MIPARGPQTKFSYIFCWYLLKPHVFCCSLGGRACQQVLRDLDYYHYSRHVERVELPRSGSAQSFQKSHGIYYLFDTHYPLAKTYVQILRKQAKTVQNVGPQC